MRLVFTFFLFLIMPQILRAQLTKSVAEFVPLSLNLAFGELKPNNLTSVEFLGSNDLILGLSSGINFGYGISERIDLKSGIHYLWNQYEYLSKIKIDILKEIVQSGRNIPNSQKDFRLEKVIFKSHYLQIPVGFNLNFLGRKSQKKYQIIISAETNILIRTANLTKHDYTKPNPPQSGFGFLFHIPGPKKEESSVLTADANKYFEKLSRPFLMYSKIGFNLMKFKKGIVEEDAYKNGIEIAWVRYFHSSYPELIIKPTGIQINLKFLLPIQKI